MIHANKVPDSLTFEQFKVLAGREPSLEGDWIYRLTHYMMDKEASYPAFNLSADEYYFRSHGEAEHFIKEVLIERVFRDSTTYGFKIEQLPIGELPSLSGAGWLYDQKGTLVDYAITTWTGNDSYQTSFFGRPDSRIRFKEGDIVEVIDGDAVKLAVVAADAPSVDWFWELYQRCSSAGFGYCADASDDCYYMIDGPGFSHHSHVNSLAMMKPRFPISDDIRIYFEHCLEHAGDEDCKARYNVASVFPRDLAVFGTIKLRIIFDNKKKRHRLQVHMPHSRMDWKPLLCESIANRYSAWLGEVQGGKSRLWYIIRDWNENHRDEEIEPYLSPDTSLYELL